MIDKYAIANEYCHECSARMDIAHPYPDHWIQNGGKPSDAKICQSCHEIFSNMKVGRAIRGRHITWAGITGLLVFLYVLGNFLSMWQIFGHR